MMFLISVDGVSTMTDDEFALAMMTAEEHHELAIQTMMIDLIERQGLGNETLAQFIALRVGGDFSITSRWVHEFVAHNFDEVLEDYDPCEIMNILCEKFGYRSTGQAISQ